MAVDTYDPSSLELAQHFLSDERYSFPRRAERDAREDALAKAIQLAVEDWLAVHPDPHLEQDPGDVPSR